MWRELQERMKVVAENTNARVFSASYNPRYGYPYRLMHAAAVDPAVREQCYELIVDSSYNDASVSNRDVLSAAIDVNADYVMPKDFPGEPERTFESLQEFVSLYREVDCNAIVMAVLQPPYCAHYEAHQQFYDQFSHFALGGLHAFDTPRDQIDAIRSFRETVGDHRYIHAFGVGTSLEMVRALRADEPFVDSIDTSTPERAIKNGQLPDRTWKQVDFEVPRGTDSTTIRAQYSSAVLYQLNYMLSRLVDDEILDVEYERTNLDDFGAVDRDGASPDGNASDFPAHQSRTDGGHDDRSPSETPPLEPDGQQSLSTYSG
jgi:hypothetical protein